VKQDKCYIAYLDFIRYALRNEAAPLNSSVRIDWYDFLQYCNRQGIVGIVFDGLQRANLKINQNLLYQWISYSEMIRQQNYVVNHRVSKIVSFFADKGYRSCILKGQANGLMYPKPEVRTPGDIDIWVEGRTEEIIKFVLSVAPSAEYSLHHIKMPVLKDVSVEVHYRPANLQRRKYDIKLQQYVALLADEQFSHKEMLDGIEIGTLTDEFNAVYQILHMYGHFFSTRNSFKQFIDYYYLLKKGISPEAKDDCLRVFKELHLTKYVSGIMWIMKEVLGLEDQSLIGEVSEKEGRLILNESLFYGTCSKVVARSMYDQTMANARILSNYPEEVLISPLYLLWHQWWKLKMKWKLK